MPKYEYTVSLIKRVLRFEEVQVRVCSNEPLTKGQAIANAECNEKLLQNLEHEEARYCLIPGGEAEVHIVHQPEEITTVNLSIDGDETNYVRKNTIHNQVLDLLSSCGVVNGEAGLKARDALAKKVLGFKRGWASLEESIKGGYVPSFTKNELDTDPEAHVLMRLLQAKPLPFEVTSKTCIEEKAPYPCHGCDTGKECEWTK